MDYSARKFPPPTIGQEVFIFRFYVCENKIFPNDYARGIVTKIARKYFTVERRHTDTLTLPYEFSIENWGQRYKKEDVSPDEQAYPSIADRAREVDEKNSEEFKKSVIEELRAKLEWYRLSDIPISKLLEIKAVLE